MSSCCCRRLFSCLSPSVSKSSRSTSSLPRLLLTLLSRGSAQGTPAQRQGSQNAAPPPPQDPLSPRPARSPPHGRGSRLPSGTTTPGSPRERPWRLAEGGPARGLLGIVVREGRAPPGAVERWQSRGAPAQNRAKATILIKSAKYYSHVALPFYFGE